MPRTRIKICGIRTPEMARIAADAGADAIGVVFVQSSPRYVEPAQAWKIVAALPPMVSSVGVFVNASLDTFSDIEEICPTSFSQLQGNEPERLVRECGPGVIKAVRYGASTIRKELERWDVIDEVDAILIDGSAGGEGTSLPWAELRAHLEGISKPIFLAGGLTPGNVGEAIRAVRPYAVDVSSGVESERGVKDPALIESFCRAVHESDRA